MDPGRQFRYFPHGVRIVQTISESTMQQHRHDSEHPISVCPTPVSDEKALHKTALHNTALHDEVHLALTRSPFFSSRNFNVELQEGRVTLKGIVRTYYQKQLAQESVRSVAGVDRVLNQLEVCS